MATSKTATPTSTRSTAAGKTSAKKSAPAAKAKAASLRFFVSADLHGRLTRLLTRLEKSQDASRHHAELSDLVVEVLDVGLDYYFIRPVKAAQAGFVIEQSANLGLVGVRRLMAPVIRNIVSRMEHEQLLSVAASIRDLMK